MAGTRANGGTVRWGVVGCGWVARDFAIPAIRNPKSAAELVAVCDPDPASMTGLPDTVARYAALDALLADKAVEAVYIATPNHLHAAQVVAAAEAGKAVLCEKPMATTPEDAERMVGACRRAGVAYATAYDQRHHPAHARLARPDLRNRLGIVTQVRLHYACWLPAAWAKDNWRIDRARAGGGAAIDLAPHGLDLISLLLNETPISVTALLQRAVQDYPVDDGAVITLAYPSGVLASMHVGYNCPDALPRRRLEIIGTEAMAVAENTMGQTPGGTLTLIDAHTGVAEPVAFDADRDPFERQISAFSAHLRSRTGDGGPDGAAFPGTPERDVALTTLLLAALDAADPKETSHAA